VDVGMPTQRPRDGGFGNAQFLRNVHDGYLVPFGLRRGGKVGQGKMKVARLATIPLLATHNARFLNKFYLMALWARGHLNFATPTLRVGRFVFVLFQLNTILGLFLDFRRCTFTEKHFSFQSTYLYQLKESY
jgi:hypothetical protein